MGFIAQEVEELLPQIVYEDDEGMKMIGYQSLIPLLTSAIQELGLQNQALRKKLAAIERQLELPTNHLISN